MWIEESRTAYLGRRKVYVIDSEEYREGTYKKLDNRYPLGVAEKKGAITEYLWYNGSTSFVDGEELKRKREDEVKAKLKKNQEEGSHNKDTKRSELFMTRLK